MSDTMFPAPDFPQPRIGWEGVVITLSMWRGQGKAAPCLSRQGIEGKATFLSPACHRHARAREKRERERRQHMLQPPLRSMSQAHHSAAQISAREATAQ